MYGSWDMVWDRCNYYFSFWAIFLHFYPPKSPKNQNLEKMKKVLEDTIILQMFTINDSHLIHGFSEGKRQNFLSFRTVFCPFTPLTTQKIKIWITEKKPTQLYQNHDHMLHCSLDIARNRCNYFPFWAIFCLFTPLTAQKIKILKKWKQCMEISSFYIIVPKIMIIWCMVPKIWCATDRWTDGRMEKVTYRGQCPT